MYVGRGSLASGCCENYDGSCTRLTRQKFPQVTSSPHSAWCQVIVSATCTCLGYKQAVSAECSFKRRVEFAQEAVTAAQLAQDLAADRLGSFSPMSPVLSFVSCLVSTSTVAIVKLLPFSAVQLRSAQNDTRKGRTVLSVQTEQRPIPVGIDSFWCASISGLCVFYRSRRQDWSGRALTVSWLPRRRRKN